MPHGAPDWNKYRVASKTFPLQDLAELAVRLGSVVSFDRRGDIAFAESFERGLQRWVIGTDGDGASVLITPTYYYHGGYSAALTAGDDDLHYAMIEHTSTLLPTGKIGFEATFSLSTNLDRVILWMRMYDGVICRETMITLDDTNDTLNSYEGAGVHPLITAVTFPTRMPYRFHHIKYVFDPTTHHYIRAIYNNTEYDISAHTYNVFALPGNPYYWARIWLYSVDGWNATIHLDSVIITQDEP